MTLKHSLPAQPQGHESLQGNVQLGARIVQNMVGEPPHIHCCLKIHCCYPRLAATWYQYWVPSQGTPRLFPWLLSPLCFCPDSEPTSAGLDFVGAWHWGGTGAAVVRRTRVLPPAIPLPVPPAERPSMLWLCAGEEEECWLSAPSQGEVPWWLLIVKTMGLKTFSPDVCSNHWATPSRAVWSIWSVTSLLMLMQIITPN